MSTLAEIRAKLKMKVAGKPANTGDIDFYKFPAGVDEVRIRVLPPWKGSEFPMKVVMRHYDIPNTEKSVVCPRAFDQSCSICEVLAKYEGRGDFVSKMSAVTQGMFNCLVRSDKTQSFDKNKIYVATGSFGLMKWLVDLWDSGDGNALIDPFEGKDVRIKREKAGGKFIFTPALSSSPLHEDPELTESLVSKVHNLDRIWGDRDDAELATIKGLAAGLEDVIENRLLAMGKTIHHDSVEETSDIPFQPEPRAIPKLPAKAAAEKKKSLDKPAGAPDCFGSSTVYDESSDLCLKCPHDYRCSVVVAAIQ